MKYVPPIFIPKRGAWDFHPIDSDHFLLIKIKRPRFFCICCRKDKEDIADPHNSIDGSCFFFFLFFLAALEYSELLIELGPADLTDFTTALLHCRHQVPIYFFFRGEFTAIKRERSPIITVYHQIGWASFSIYLFRIHLNWPRSCASITLFVLSLTLFPWEKM